jgi:hypothetical protein
MFGAKNQSTQPVDLNCNRIDHCNVHETHQFLALCEVMSSFDFLQSAAEAARVCARARLLKTN